MNCIEWNLLEKISWCKQVKWVYNGKHFPGMFYTFYTYILFQIQYNAFIFSTFTTRQHRTGQDSMSPFLCLDRKCANLYNYYLFNLLLLKLNEHCWKKILLIKFFGKIFLRRFASKIFMFFSCQLCESSQVSHSIQKKRQIRWIIILFRLFSL